MCMTDEKNVPQPPTPQPPQPPAPQPAAQPAQPSTPASPPAQPSQPSAAKPAAASSAKSATPSVPPSLPPRKKVERPNWRKPQEDALKLAITNAKLLITNFKAGLPALESSILQRATTAQWRTDIEQKKLALGRAKMSISHLDSIVQEINRAGDLRFTPIERYLARLNEEMTLVRGYISSLAGSKSKLLAEETPNTGDDY